MFKVGERVLCVNNTPDPNHPLDINIWPKKGKIYTIRGIYVSNRGIPAVYLEEINNGINTLLGMEIGFKADRFRKLDFADDVLKVITEEIKKEEVVTYPAGTLFCTNYGKGYTSTST